MAGPESTSPELDSDPASRLAALRIDRERPVRQRTSTWRWGLILAAAAGAGAGILLFPWQQGAPAGPSPAAAGPAMAQSSSSADRVSSSPPVPPTAAAPDSVLDATGYVVARRQATVSAKVTGKVEAVLVEEGMQVAAGQVIARLDDRVERAELALAQARLEAAAAALGELDAEVAHEERMLTRTRVLAARRLVSETDLETRRLARDTFAARRERARREVGVAAGEVAVQRRRLDDLTIRAPFAGVVVDKAAQPGEMVSPVSAGGGFTRTGIGTIVDMTSLEVDVEVNESYINRVHAGQAATVTLNAYPDHPYAASVLAVVPTADRTRGTVPVRIALDGLDERVLPDMGVHVAFLDQRVDQATEGHHDDHGAM